jgi:hypothetical protein
MLEENSIERRKSSNGEKFSDKRKSFTQFQSKMLTICNTYILMHTCTIHVERTAIKLKKNMKYYVYNI